MSCPARRLKSGSQGTVATVASTRVCCSHPVAKRIERCWGWHLVEGCDTKAICEAALQARDFNFGLHALIHRTQLSATPAATSLHVYTGDGEQVHA